MISLDSPMDALLFDYVSFGIFTVVNNLWTWVAVVTAAVSFWGIRAVGAGAIKMLEPSTSSDYIERNITESTLPETSSSTLESVTEAAALGSVGSSPLVFEDNGVTKGKFMAYYYEEDDRENDGNADGADGVEELTVFREWGSCGGELRERMLRVRMEDYGWYRWQDLTVINGDVVRLWDGVRRKKNIPCCVGW